MRQSLDQFDLCLPATFAHQGPSHTWASRTTLFRYHLVGVSRNCADGVQDSFVDQEIDLTTKKIDHSVAAVTIALATTQQKAPYARWKLPYARASLVNPGNAAAFAQWLDSPPFVPWTADTHANCDVLNKWVVEGLIHTCPILPRKPKPD